MSPSFKHLVNCSRDSAYSTAAVRSSWDPTQTPAASLRALSPRHATQEEVFTSSTPPKVKHELCILQFLLECHEEENDDVALLSVRSPALPASIICRHWHFFRRRGMTSSHMRNHGQSRSDQWSIHDPLDPDMQVSYKCHQIISSLDSTNCLALRLPRPKWQTTGHLRTCLQALHRSVTVDSLVWFTV